MLNSAVVEPVPASPLETSPRTNPAPLSPLARLAWATLILVTLGVCYFSHLGAIGFVGPDEPRYAWIARDMAETGDWVTPRLYGKPWFEKPPFYYWSAAISFKLFGVSETAARLPSAVGALLATLALAWLAWRLYGGETACWLLLLLPTSVGMLGFSHAASTDMLFSGMLTLALVAACAVLRLVSAPLVPALLLFGFFLGLAVLAKGPAAVVLLGGAVFFWALISKRWRDAFRLFHPAALATFILTALPWYIICARRNPDFFRVFIIEHNFKRYLTPEFQHNQPFWYYGVVLLVALLPWTALFVWSLASGSLRVSRTRRISDATLLLLCWSAFTLLFFTISKSKLPGYVLPAVPCIGVLTTFLFVRHLRFTTILGRALLSTSGFTLILLGLVVSRFADKIPFVTDIRPAPGIGAFVYLMIMGGVVSVLLAILRLGRTALAVPVLTILAWLLWGTGSLWELDAGLSARPAVATLRTRLTGPQLRDVMTYELRRDFKYEVDFYLHREVAEWPANNSTPSVVLTNWKRQQELEQAGVRCFPYGATPAVTICEDIKGGRSLLDAAGGGKTK